MHTHGKFLQDAQRAMLKPWHRHAPVDQRFVPDGCALGPFDADALLGSVGVNNTLWLVRTADPLQIPSEAQRARPVLSEVSYKQLFDRHDSCHSPQ